MAHDFSHLVNAVWMNVDIIKAEADAAVTETLAAITPSDLAALLADKCPGWVALPRKMTAEMLKSTSFGVPDMMIEAHNYVMSGRYYALISTAPKLGDE